MKRLNDYLTLTDEDLRRLEDVRAGYRRMYEEPQRARPMFIIEPAYAHVSWEERLADPLVMLKGELDRLRGHLAIGDDAMPTVRVQFGTPQVAAAFGCQIHIPPNSLPAAGSRVLASAADVYKLAKPSLAAGWYGKLAEYTRVFLENLPRGVHVQHPDIQSAFNTAHLVRGDGIFTDFYDDPQAVEALLGLVTDYMIELTEHLKAMISTDRAWFFDFYAMWKGFARISNCSMHMISPEFYRRHVLPQDLRFFQAVGGGRMHYCGSNAEVLPEFFAIPDLSGLDFPSQRHDPWRLSEMAPPRLTLMTSPREGDSVMSRLLAGDWPKKRNIILTTGASSVEAGKDLLSRLRASIPY